MTVLIMFKKCFGCISADQFMSRHNDCDTRLPSQATECITQRSHIPQKKRKGAKYLSHRENLVNVFPQNNHNYHHNDPNNNHYNYHHNNHNSFWKYESALP